MDLKTTRHLREVSVDREKQGPRMELWVSPVVTNQKGDEEPLK